VSSRPARGQELFHSFPPITVLLVRPTLAQTTRQTVIGNIKTYVNYTYAYHQKCPLGLVQERGLRKGTWWKIQKAIGWSRGGRGGGCER
jgi:hypothetical protein